MERPHGPALFRPDTLQAAPTDGGGGGYEMRRTGEHELALGDRLPQPKRGGDNAGIAFFGIFKMSSTWRTQEELPGLELT